MAYSYDVTIVGKLFYKGQGNKLITGKAVRVLSICLEKADWNIGFGVVIDCTSSFKKESRRSHTHTHTHTHRGNNTPVLVKTVRVYFSSAITNRHKK